MIGSHNFDPRSEGFNTENGLIIWDEVFARKLEGIIRRDIEPQNSWIVAMKPRGELEKNRTGACSQNHTAVQTVVLGFDFPLRIGAGQGAQASFITGLLPELLRGWRFPRSHQDPPAGHGFVPRFVFLFPRTHSLT